MVFLELSYFLDDPVDVGNLIFGFSAFSKSSLNTSKFLVQVLLKSSLENFEYFFVSVWDECNYAVLWTFFGIAFLWDWNENWPFPALGPLLSFPNLLVIEYSTFTASSFRIWNSSTGTPSPPLALFVWCFLRPTWRHIPGCLALGRRSHHRDYLGCEDLFCIVLLDILATSS